MVARFKIFRSTWESWETMCTEVTVFLSQIGPDKGHRRFAKPGKHSRRADGLVLGEIVPPMKRPRQFH